MEDAKRETSQTTTQPAVNSHPISKGESAAKLANKLAKRSATISASISTSAATEKEELEALAQMQARFSASGLAYDGDDLVKGESFSTSLWARLKPALAIQAGMRSATLNINGLDLCFWQGGDKRKPVLVLIHGFSSSKENWGLVARPLLKHFHVLAPDVNGFGNSGFDRDLDWSLPAQADRLIAWLDELDITSAYIVGNSMGGALAALIASKKPDIAAGVCLMNAAGVPGSRLSMLEVGILSGKNYLVPSSRGDALRMFGIAVNNHSRWLGRGFGLLLAGDLIQRENRHRFLFTEMVDSLHSVYQCLPLIKAQTLVLWGDSDQVLDCSSTDVFKARIADANVFVLPTVGHLPMIEAPKDTITLISAFATQAINDLATSKPAAGIEVAELAVS
jgi:pimeloyl-ACP methyl ester carboxylesterase